jgi:hypothetical protein
VGLPQHLKLDIFDERLSTATFAAAEFLRADGALDICYNPSFWHAAHRTACNVRGFSTHAASKTYSLGSMGLQEGTGQVVGSTARHSSSAAVRQQQQSSNVAEQQFRTRGMLHASEFYA